ncbi:unnamed protein product [Boreogadus saida]
MLKPYQGRDADPGLGSQRPAEHPVEEVADGAVKPGSACTLAVCSVGSVGVAIALETGEDDVEVPSKALVQGRVGGAGDTLVGDGLDGPSGGGAGTSAGGVPWARLHGECDHYVQKHVYSGVWVWGKPVAFRLLTSRECR